MIHPTAIVHPKAQLDPTAAVGPYAIIDEGVVVGAKCSIGPYAHLTGQTVIGERNVFHTSCVMGGAPQDLKYENEPTRLRIGDDNVFREYCTVHRSNQRSEATEIGSHNYFMVNSHVGHNARLGDHIILVNGALLAGHVVVEDRVIISGHCLVHQFVRLGTLALMQGGAGLSKDLPPFTVARGINAICGLNTVGLRRAGFTGEQRLEMKRLYHALFRTRLTMSEAVERARPEFRSEHAKMLLDFVAASKRGVCADPGKQEEV